MCAVEMTARECWVNTPKGQIFVTIWGSDAEADCRYAPIVLMHDSLGSVELWRDFPRHLAQATRRRVVTYDRLGFGRSDACVEQVELDFIKREAFASFKYVREALSLDRFVVVGHSVGGGMAVGVAAAYPDECTGLITLSAQAFVEEKTLVGIRAAQQSFAQAEQISRLARYHGERTRWVLAAWIDRWLDPEFADWNLDADLMQVKCPSLVLYGRRDEYGSLSHPERIANLNRGRSTLKIGDWGHMPHREASDEVLSLMTAWLSELGL
jgi:pimeloyl-ACP methyl ester carboxylesterase